MSIRERLSKATEIRYSGHFVKRERGMSENFSVDNGSLYSVYIAPDEYPITAHEELKLQIYIRTYGDEALGALKNRSATVKYAGQAIAHVKW